MDNLKTGSKHRVLLILDAITALRVKALTAKHAGRTAEYEQTALELATMELILDIETRAYLKTA